MTDPTLSPNQWAIGSYVFGRATSVEVTDFDTGGKPDTTAGDNNLPNEDGIRFGYDYLGSRTLTVDLLINEQTAEAGRSTWRTLASLWNAQALRYTPNAVTYLRMNLLSSDPVRVYGRPRKLDQVTGLWSEMSKGAIPLIATFAASDDKFYSDTETTSTLTLVPEVTGGLIPPFTPPLYLLPSASNSDVVTNLGDLPTWPVITFNGPIAKPYVSVVGTDLSLQLNTSLTVGQSVTIDTRPWARSVTRQDGGSLAGYLSGSRLAEFSLPPGQSEIAFRGQDLTGTSTCSISFRSAYSTC